MELVFKKCDYWPQKKSIFQSAPNDLKSGPSRYNGLKLHLRMVKVSSEVRKIEKKPKQIKKISLKIGTRCFLEFSRLLSYF